MNWVNSFVYRLIFLLICIVIINSGQSKNKQKYKKTKAYKPKYEVSKKQAKENKKYYKYSSDKSSKSKDKSKNKLYQDKYLTKNIKKQVIKPTVNKNQQKADKITNQQTPNKINNDSLTKKIPITTKESIKKIITHSNNPIHPKQQKPNIIENKDPQTQPSNIKQPRQQQQTPSIPIIQHYTQQTYHQQKQQQLQSEKQSEIQSEITNDRDYGWQPQSKRDSQEQIVNKCDQKAVYDYNLLVLTWVPNQCYADKDCQKDWLTAQQLRSPTIHMFKPYGSSSYYSECFEQKGDDHCRQDAYMTDYYFDYDEALRDTEGLLYDMSQFWPAQKFTHDEQAFYAQQWINHGTCYLMNMIEDNQRAYKMDRQTFNRTIMMQYFRTAIIKYKKLRIDVQPGSQYESKQQFASRIGFRNKETHFMIYCNNKNQIIQITFCFNRSKLPGREVTIPCTFDDNCDQDLPLKIKQPL